MKIEALKELGINPSEDLKHLIESYIAEFLKYNAHTNLISKNDEKVLFEKHIFDSLAIAKFLGADKCKKILDIGTGGGFPAIPIALVFPNINITGVDSIAKKTTFINNLAVKLGLKNLNAINSRTEDLPEKFREQFDAVTCRAVAPLNVIIEYAAPYLRVGGHFIAYKSKIATLEIEQAKNALKTLNCKIEDIIDYKLPLEENFERNLIIIKKLHPTPKEFPRHAGIAKSNPL